MVGMKVGELEGLCETEGEVVGCEEIVGESDGLSLGLIDGLAHGKLVGALEIEGAPVGDSEGDKVGRCEGCNNEEESIDLSV